MNKLIVLLVVLLLSATAFAHDPFVRVGGGYGAGGAGYSDQYSYGDHRSKSIGRQIAEAGVGGAIAVAAIPIGAAIGDRVAQAISGTPTQQPRVAYAQQPQVVVVAACTPRSFYNAPLWYTNWCDGRGFVVDERNR